MPQSVFFFGDGAAEGTRDMKAVLGGKGANLAEMTNLGVPVPPGFTIACSECVAYLRDGKYSDRLRAEVEGNVARLEAGESLQPAGCGGSIAGHVAGEEDGYISASLEPEGTEKYASGNGMVAIDVATAVAGGAKFIDHNNVMQAVKREGTLKDVANARDSQEVLFDDCISLIARLGHPLAGLREIGLSGKIRIQMRPPRLM